MISSMTMKLKSTRIISLICIIIQLVCLVTLVLSGSISSEMFSLQFNSVDRSAEMELERVLAQNAFLQQQPILTTNFQSQDSRILQSQSTFQQEIYPVDRYYSYAGRDETALFASSVAIGKRYAAVGSNGYSK
jgi:hypothetical protein